MPQAFLSHSSVQKPFLNKIADDLKSYAIIDSKSFEEGMLTSEEIVHLIDKTDLFVLFLSNEALNSNWVLDEINLAKERLDSNALTKIYPLIIDPQIQYNDARIPDWLKENYNLKHVLRTGKASRLIKRRLQEVTWNKHPRLKERDTVFVGRNEEIKKFEERIDDLSLPSPYLIIASGLPQIGRRTFLKHALVKTNALPKDSYDFPLITLNRRESIEDFILKLYDLGFSEEMDFPDFIEATLETKIEIALKLIGDCQAFNEVILIEDNGGVILPDRNLVKWFKNILERWKDFNFKEQVTLCVASQFKPGYKDIVGYSDTFHIEISELSKIESAGLLKRLSNINEISISNDDLKKINDHLNGFPEQVRYCIDLLKKTNTKHVLNEINVIKDYQRAIFNKIVTEIETDHSYRSVLSILTEFDFISHDLLTEILFDLSELDVTNIIDDLIGRSVVEYIGSSKEYIRLNQGIRDFLLRAGYTINSKYKEKLKGNIENYLKTFNFSNSDLSNFFYSLKGALLNNYSFQSRLLLPSHYLKTMITLYEQQSNYKDVVILADKILERESKLDISIAYEIRWWLCLALARLKNERLKSEVHYFKGSDHNFLLGFYYRISGQAEAALERFELALKERPKFSRAQRELVRVLSYLELHEEAFQLAKLNYEYESSNPFHAQAYFDCLVRRPDAKNHVETIKDLLEEMSLFKTEKAKELASVAKADFQLFIRHDTAEALRLINETLIEFPRSPYILHKKFTIAEKAGNKVEMADTLNKYEKIVKKDNENQHNSLLVMRARFEAHQNNPTKALHIINNELKGIPSRVKASIIQSVGL